MIMAANINQKRLHAKGTPGLTPSHALAEFRVQALACVVTDRRLNATTPRGLRRSPGLGLNYRLQSAPHKVQRTVSIVPR